MKYFFPILLILKIQSFAQLNADFSASVRQGCSPLVVQFTDNSTGSPSSRFWDFGNGITSTEQNPTVTYTNDNSFTVRLIIRTLTAQDYEEKTDYIKVFKTPVAGFITNIDSGCIPLAVSFTDTTALSGISVKNFLWRFGDSIVSSEENPQHIYETAGKFNVSFALFTQDGCRDKISEAISVGFRPIVDFTASPLDGCASVLRQFTSNSSNITSSYWDFGDGTVSTEISPLYHYMDTGWFSIKLIAANNGCKDSGVKTNYIHVNRPVAMVKKFLDCDNRSVLNFKNVSTSRKINKWNFGDGTIAFNQRIVTHTYSSTGIYLLRLIVDEGTCSDTATNVVYVPSIKPVAGIEPKQNVYCRGDSLNFIFTDYDSLANALFAWNFGNGDSLNFDPANDTVHYVYNKNGSFQVFAYFKDRDKCIDTISFNPVLNIKGPFAGFTNQDILCTGTEINFTDQSFPGGAPITKWSLNYDDGIINDKNPFIYSYIFPGIYNVTLTTTDSNACRDSVIHAVQITETPALNAAPDKLLCLGKSDTLSASGAKNYSWLSNNDTICNFCNNMPVSPSSGAVYYVIGTNPPGCSAIDSVIIRIQQKQNMTVQSLNFSICEGSSIQLKAKGKDLYSWSPATGLSNASLANPYASPSSSTVYTVIGKDSNSCFSDTAVITVAVNSLPAVNIIDDSVKMITGSTYTIISTTGADTKTLQWRPATWLSCYDCLKPVASVTNTLTYTLTATNKFGCSSSDKISIISICSGEAIYIPNTFSPNNDGVNDYFYPRAKGNLNIQALTIFSRSGQVVFQKHNLSANNYMDGWDGKRKNNLQSSDIYMYIMEIRCANNTILTKKGNITLLR